MTEQDMEKTIFLDQGRPQRQQEERLLYESKGWIKGVQVFLGVAGVICDLCLIFIVVPSLAEKWRNPWIRLFDKESLWLMLFFIIAGFCTTSAAMYLAKAAKYAYLKIYEYHIEANEVATAPSHVMLRFDEITSISSKKGSISLQADAKSVSIMCPDSATAERLIMERIRAVKMGQQNNFLPGYNPYQNNPYQNNPYNGYNQGGYNGYNRNSYSNGNYNNGNYNNGGNHNGGYNNNGYNQGGYNQNYNPNGYNNNAPNRYN